MRIVEWLDNSVKPFHLEVHSSYDDKWHLRLFPNNMPCVFGTKEEAQDYAKNNPVKSTCIIHTL